jgi:hypothetical protein
MTDLEDRGYLERHCPANLEFDQAPMTVEVRLVNNTRAHRLFTNDAGRECDGGRGWRVRFPEYFNCASCYLHLTSRPVEVRTRAYDGRAGREIPVTSYGEDAADAERAAEAALAVLGELEAEYGPYAHNALLIYCSGAGAGGMEYAGATVTGLASLAHEVAHSWFGRGVMPADANAGWVDEAVAAWRDRGYPRAAAWPPPVRPAVNLAGFSPYHRHTPPEA